MLFRYLFILILLVGIIPDSAHAQLPVVGCLEDVNDVFPGNKKAQDALDDACKQVKLHTVAGYTSAVQILKGIMDTLPKESVSLMTWKIDLEDAINNAEPVSAPSPAEEKMGGCCLPDYHCEYVTLKVCTERKGNWQEGVSCDAIPCSVPVAEPAPKVEPAPEPTPVPVPKEEPVVTIKTGACILPDGSCMFLAENVCATQHGVFKGEGIKCDDIPPLHLLEKQVLRVRVRPKLFRPRQLQILQNPCRFGPVVRIILMKNVPTQLNQIAKTDAGCLE